MSEVIRSEIRLVVDLCDRAKGCICEANETGNCRWARRKVHHVKDVAELQRVKRLLEPDESTLF